MKRYRFLFIVGIITLAVLAPMVTQASTVYASTGGLTPGYWKQQHHFDDWGPTGYAPGDKVDVVFSAFVLAHGVPYYGPIENGFGSDLTLLQALKQGGGGEKALLRQAVAALLNCTHPDIQMVSEVVLARWINYAYYPSSHSPPYSFEDVKDHMEGWNTFDPNFEL